MLPIPSSIPHPLRMQVAPDLHKAFDYKNARDYVVVVIMSVPLLVLSIFGVLYVMQLTHLG